MVEFKFLNSVKEYVDRDMVSFHIPGHKGGRLYRRYPELEEFGKMLKLDTTDTPYTDNYFEPKTIIKEAQDKAAKFYNCQHTIFLINGTSVGNIAAMLAVLKPKDKIIVGRDAHKSINHALILGDITAEYIYPDIHPEFNLPMGITPEKVEKAIIENPDAKAVLVTYPNYFGVGSDIVGIGEVCKKYDKILIVDEAHAPHFNLSDELPPTALSAGAGIVNQSTHKTLGAMTQSSMLHINSDKVDMDYLNTVLIILQSSSPNYLFLESLDISREICEKDGKELMAELLTNARNFRKEVAKLDGVKLINESVIGTYGIKYHDPTRLVINMSELGIDGVDLDKLLMENYGIQAEMAIENNIVCVTSIGNVKEDFDKLLFALKDIKEKYANMSEIPELLYYEYKANAAVSPREAFYSDKETIKLADSLGKISAQYVIPYPPGIPVLCPGEVITKEAIDFMTSVFERGCKGTRVIGMNDDRIIEVIK